MDTIWSDVSEWQVPVDDFYPYPVLAIRSNDGTYRDQHFATNYAWACAALDSGRLKCLIIYLVYRPDWQADLATLEAALGGPPHPRTAFMLDVESWSGQITGDQSAAIDALYQAVASWVGSSTRVIGYGNTGDLNTLWPTRPAGARLIIAAYGTNPDYPGELGHQFTDGLVGGALAVPPFGAADVNSADGYDIDAFCTALGLASRTRRHNEMDELPATPAPADPNSAPASWPQRVFDVGFDLAGGWEGDFAFEFGAQEWGGRTVDDARAFLALASWQTPTGLVPATPALTVGGAGEVVHDHQPTLALKAPTGATALVLNYAAPGGAYVTEGRSA